MQHLDEQPAKTPAKDDLPTAPKRVNLPPAAHRTDTANARRFARQWRNKVRYVPVRRKWFLWNGHRWNEDTQDAVFELAKKTALSIFTEASDETISTEEARELGKWAAESLCVRQLRAMIALAGSERGIATAPDDFDRHPYVLNTPQGVVDLRTGALREAQPKDLLRQITRVGPAEGTPTRWLQFLNEDFLGDQELIDYVQKVLGYALLGRVQEHILVVCWGRGGNGKSTLLETIGELLGDYTYILPEGALLKSRFDDKTASWLGQLYGRRFVLAQETDQGRELSESFVKNLTKGDTRNAKLLYEHPFVYTPSDTIFMATNYRPHIQGGDHGIWRRVKLIPFRLNLPEDQQEKGLREKLIATEGPQILQWLVEGCVAYLAEGLHDPQAVRDATADYRAESDSVGAYLAISTRPAVNGKIKASVLHEAYALWCENSNMRVLGPKAFNSELSDRGILSEHSRDGKVFLGIEFALDMRRPFDDPFDAPEAFLAA